MRIRGWLLLLGLVLGGCTREVDTPQPQREPPVAPILAQQVGDLLSPKVQHKDGNRFITVEPEECRGVAIEVDPPFIVDHDPAAVDGGHWLSEGGPEVVIEEIVAVYRADYDPRAALADAKRAIDSCRDVPFTVTSMSDRVYEFTLLPEVNSGSPDILLWSFSGYDWACDNALVASHNAAVEITTCGAGNGYDVLSLAHDSLKRIDTLANTAA